MKKRHFASCCQMNCYVANRATAFSHSCLVMIKSPPQKPEESRHGKRQIHEKSISKPVSYI